MGSRWCKTKKTRTCKWRDSKSCCGWRIRMSDRHVLITGGAGYIGSLLTSELLRANYRVTVLDSLLFGGESLVSFLPHPNFHFVKADVTEPRAVKDVLKVGWQKPEAIVHLAAIVGFPACQAVRQQVAWRYNLDA